jgi:transposase
MAVVVIVSPLRAISGQDPGEVSRARLCPDHGEIFFWLSLLRALVRVVYDAGSPGGCGGGARSCDPIQISVHVAARGAGSSPDGVGG